jgi:hypothetical protein
LDLLARAREGSARRRERQRARLSGQALVLEKLVHGRQVTQAHRRKV